LSPSSTVCLIMLYFPITGHTISPAKLSISDLDTPEHKII
jgi:hypothetical protein